MQSQDDQWISPSFNTYSQNNLTDIAVKVTKNANDSNKEDDDFEFSSILNNHLQPSHAHDETIQTFPIFNNKEKDDDIVNSMNVPLSRLFIDEKEDEASSSSSSSSEGEGGDVASVAPGSYCVWKPRMEGKCKKSKSTGFGSKRWKLKDFMMRRSNSEGKGSFVFLPPKIKEEKKNSKAAKSLISKKSTTKHPGWSLGLGLGLSLGFGLGSSKARKSSKKPSSISLGSGSGLGSGPSRMIYAPGNRAIGRGNGEMVKRRSYLPYREDLVGFFTTVNSIGRNFTPL